MATRAQYGTCAACRTGVLEPRPYSGDHGLSSASAEKTDFRFLRFRPPLLERDGADEPALPHIRLDRALQFLIGDRLQ